MPRTDRIPFVPRHAMVAVPATLNGLDFVLLVDSGCERMVISRRAAQRLGLDLLHPLRSEPLVGVGQTVQVPVIRLSHVQVGGSRVTGLLASVYDVPPLFRVDGLLGLSFLSRFRVTLAFDTRTLVLRQPAVGGHLSGR